MKAACIHTIGMPGENCAFPQCPISRNKKYEGIGLFKLPGYPGPFHDEWRRKLLPVLFKYREADKELKERAAKKRIWFCERHFTQEYIDIFRCGVHTHPYRSHSPVYPMFPSRAFIFIFCPLGTTSIPIKIQILISNKQNNIAY